MRPRLARRCVLTFVAGFVLSVVSAWVAQYHLHVGIFLATVGGAMVGIPWFIALFLNDLERWKAGKDL